MLLLKEDQVRQKVENVAIKVGEELAVYKSVPVNQGLKPFSGFDEEFSFELSKPYNVSQRFTAKELYDKIRLAFEAQKMNYYRK